LKKLRTYILILTLLLSTYSFSQYNIEVNVKNLSNTNLYLGFHYGTRLSIIDTTVINKDGVAIFSGKHKLNGGIYFIAFPSNNYFDFLINENTNFKISTDTTDFLNHLSFENSPENQLFLDYQKKSLFFRNQMAYEYSKLEKYKNIPDSVDYLKSKIEIISRKMKIYKSEVGKKNSSTLFAKIIYTLSEPLVPKPDFSKLKDYNVNPDSVLNLYSYTYYKNHYFDHFDFSDTRMLYTSILPKKISTFYSNIVDPSPDSLQLETIKLINKSFVKEESFRFTLNYLIKMFETSGEFPNNELFVMLAEKYYLNNKANWVSQEFLKQLKLRVEALKPNIVGKIAPELNLLTDKDEAFSLDNIKDKYIVLYFWDTNCEHCKVSTPIAHKIAKKYKDEIAFVSVYTQIEKTRWLGYIKENKLNSWTNIFDKDGSSNMFINYDLYKTPRIYVLDKDKKIIEKEIETKDLEEYIENLEKCKKTKK